MSNDHPTDSPQAEDYSQPGDVESNSDGTPFESPMGTPFETTGDFDPDDRADFDQLKARAEDVVENEDNETTITFEDLSNREVLTLISCLAAGAEQYASAESPEQAGISKSLYERAAEQAENVHGPLHDFFGAVIYRAIESGELSENGPAPTSIPSRIHSTLTNPGVSTALIFSLVALYIISGIETTLSFGLLPSSVPSVLFVALLFVFGFYFGVGISR